jgi:hypothetical protein
MGVLFAIGSLCFAVGALPFYARAFDVTIDSLTFFVGSIFFTTAALLQLLEARASGTKTDRIASAIQFVGTLFFNATTFYALNTSWSAQEADKYVWRPDAFGSICFLISSAMVYEVFANPGRFDSWLPHRRDWQIAVLNFGGSVAFAISAIFSYIVPSTGEIRSAEYTNLGTFVGAIGFFLGAVLVLVDREHPQVATA